MRIGESEFENILQKQCITYLPSSPTPILPYCNAASGSDCNEGIECDRDEVVEGKRCKGRGGGRGGGDEEEDVVAWTSAGTMKRAR